MLLKLIKSSHHKVRKFIAKNSNFFQKKLHMLDTRHIHALTR